MPRIVSLIQTEAKRQEEEVAVERAVGEGLALLRVCARAETAGVQKPAGPQIVVAVQRRCLQPQQSSRTAPGEEAVLGFAVKHAIIKKSKLTVSQLDRHDCQS